MGALDAAEASAAIAASAELAALCPASDEPQLDANRLHVYHVALELHCLCSTLVATLKPHHQGSARAGLALRRPQHR